MYPEQITYRSMGRVLSIFSFTLGCTLAVGCMQQVHAQDASGNLFPLTSRFDLLAADGSLADDCDPGFLAVAAGEKDVIQLAKLDGQKPSTGAATSPAAGKGRERNGSSASASPDVERLPAALPQNPTAPEAQQTWEIIVSDKTLNAALARWASKAGWQLVWELPVDYSVETRTTVYGSFEEAVSTVARSMESAEIPMKAMFYQGNKVLRILAKGAE
jgi:hypothetical protein